MGTRGLYFEGRHIGAKAFSLSRKQVEVLDLIKSGYINKQIGLELRITEQTAKNHVSAILRKLNVDTRVSAVVEGLKLGIISLNGKKGAESKEEAKEARKLRMEVEFTIKFLRKMVEVELEQAREEISHDLRAYVRSLSSQPTKEVTPIRH